MQFASPHLGRKRLGELVKKIETSATALKKRLRTAKKKLKLVAKQHRRIAKNMNLYAVAVTLTYRYSADFTPKNISRFVTSLRDKLKRKGHKLLYQWVLEQSDVLHHHLVLWLPRGTKLDSAYLERLWTWGSTWISSCRKVAAWVKYMAKKETKQKLPGGARSFGYGGLDDEGHLALAVGMLPIWLRGLLPQESRPRRIPRIGWTDLNTGVVFISPWRWTPLGQKLKVRCS